MNVRRGKFIVIEGTDGSGKTEQFKLLVRALRRRGVRVETIDFPQYGRKSAYFAERYLNGDYGAWSGSHEKIASLFFALDRFDAGVKIRKWLADGVCVIANRYVASNMGHQGAKLTQKKSRTAFIRWIHDFEYGLLKIPKPDLNIFLNVPPRIAYRLIAQKHSRKYLRGKTRDIHEASLKHLFAAHRTYSEITKMYPREFRVVGCASHGALLSVKEIHAQVLQLVLKHVS